MNSAKKIILPGLFTALLIGGQLALSGISGVEVVTVLLLTFVYIYGIGQGLLVANAFLLLRCFVFGFISNVIVLYLIYYNIFVLVFGFIGKLFRHEYNINKHIIVLFISIIMTAMFTMIDNILTPLMYGFTANAAKAYFVASLYTVVPQIICTFVTVLIIFPGLLKVLK